jgi:PAS domain S-box-containing protein
MRELHERLASERDKLRAIFESAALGIFRIDADGIVLDVNPAALRMLGLLREQVAGERLWGLLSDACVPDSVARPSSRGSRLLEHRYTHPSGETVSFHATETWVRDVAGTIQFGTVIMEDVTEKKHLEGSLRHAQKLESVGRLAAGIAHEINTPIQFVNDNVHFLNDSFAAMVSLVGSLREVMSAHGVELVAACDAAEASADWTYLREEVPKSVAQTLEGLTRVATIVHSMKSFAHDDGGEQAPSDLNAALTSTLVVARHEIKGIALTVMDFGDIPPVMCCRGDLNQVFLNIIVNAAHAISSVVAKTGELGRISVATRRDGEDVVISITDTGGGIPEAVAAKMFDPFFTTKEVGRGSGQGLALARNIVVKRHGGAISFDTELGVGTTFVIRLPIAGARARTVARQAA